MSTSRLHGVFQMEFAFIGNRRGAWYAEPKAMEVSVSAVTAQAELKALLKKTAREGDALLRVIETRFEERVSAWKKTSPNRRAIQKRYRDRLSAARKAIEAATIAAQAL